MLICTCRKRIDVVHKHTHTHTKTRPIESDKEGG